MTPPVLTVFPEDSLTVVLVVVSALGGGEGGGKERNLNANSSIIFDSHFKLTDGRLVLSKTTALSPWLPDSAPSSGSTLRDTEVIIA